MGVLLKINKKSVISYFLFFVFSLLNAQKISTTPICTMIEAKKSAVNKIELSWNINSDSSASSIAIFRSTSPIQLSSEISAEKPIAEVPSHTRSYTDTLKYFGDYYYALIARDKNGNLFDTVLPSVNSTVKPVKLIPPDDYVELSIDDEKQYIPGLLRELPLPYLALISDLNVKPTPFSPKAVNIANELSKNYRNKKPKLLNPYVFKEDLVRSPNGDDFFLFESLKTYFIKKDYKGSVEDLIKFLSIKRDDFVTTRAVFYLAESHYYCKNYRYALELFLYLEDELPELSKKWIDSTLDFYTIPNDKSK